MIVRLARRAHADVRNLLAWSLATWGADAAARYADTLATAIDMIGAAPNGPTTRDRAELLAGLRCLHLRRARGRHGVRAPVHVIYYRVVGDAVEVVRILHEHMDPGLHLVAPARTRRRPRQP